MSEAFNQIRKQLNEFWTGLDKGKRKLLVIGSLLLIFSVTAIILITTSTSYVPVYNTALDDREAAIIIEKLDELGISWEDGNGFNQILVPSNQVNQVKRELAKDGFTNEGLGFNDVIEKDSITMTGDQRKWMRERALENELARDISGMEGVADATVRIYKPEEQGFVINSNKEATATVFIIRATSMPFPSGKVVSIQTYVAGAVGMKTENVEVIDDAGNYLSSQSSSDNAFNTNEQFALQYSIQASLDSTIDKFLETVFGYGNVAVTSSVKVNFDSEITSIKEFAPPIEGNDEGLIRSLQKMEESTVNGSTGGIPGTESNTGDVTDYAQEDGSTSKYNNASETINYELNEINRQISRSPGDIESITVAVLINKVSLPDGELTDEIRQQITNLIYAATGLDTKNVAVSAYQFSDNNVQLYDDTQSTGFNASENIPLIAGLGLALLAFGGFIGFLVNRRRKANEKADLEKMIEERTDAMADLEEIDFDSEKSQVKKQIGTFVEKKPDAVAQLLRSWLNEE